MVVYLDAFGIPAVVTAMAVGAVTAGVVHVLTKDEEELPALDCGTKWVCHVKYNGWHLHQPCAIIE